MGDLVGTVAVLFVWCGLLASMRDGFDRREWNWILASLAAHLVSTVATTAMSLLAGGMDLIGYVEIGRFLAELLRRDFERSLPEVMKLLLHSPDAVFSEAFAGAGDPTGSMKAISGFVMLLVDDSMWAGSFLLTAFSFFGKVALYRAFRDEVPEAWRKSVALATLLTPSYVFWSCGFVKETIAISGLGWLLYGAQCLARVRILRAIVALGIAGFFVGMVKPYVLFPFVLVAGVYIYAHRAAKTSARLVVKPVYFVVGLGVAVAGIALLNVLFPRYAVDSISESTMRQQEAAAVVEGNTNFSYGDVPATRSGQLALAPIAFLTALFRPLPFEASNVLSLVCSLETTALLILTLRAFKIRGPRAIWNQVRKTPLLLFSVLFTIIFGTAVGLSTLNFGSLSRYRIPLMPFFVVLCLVFNLPQGEEEELEDADYEGEAPLDIEPSGSNRAEAGLREDAIRSR